MSGLRVLVTGGSGASARASAPSPRAKARNVAFTWHGNKAGADATEKVVRRLGRECLPVKQIFAMLMKQARSVARSRSRGA
jgi:hypothetical protein